MVQIEQITTDAEIDRLAPQWKALWRRIPDATPFQSPEWLLSWWRCFGTARPVILVARKASELIGVLPLYFLDEGVSSKLLPIGISLSDYLDALVDRSIRGTVDAMLAAIAEIPGWDECHLPSMSPDGSLFTASLPSGLIESRHPTSRAHCLCCHLRSRVSTTCCRKKGDRICGGRSGGRPRSPGRHSRLPTMPEYLRR